jgi:hypothetical protein
MSASVPGPNSSSADKIKWIYKGYEDPSKYLTKEPETEELELDVKKLYVKDEEISLEEQIRRDFRYIGGPKDLNKTPKKKGQDASSSSWRECQWQYVFLVSLLHIRLTHS